MFPKFTLKWLTFHLRRKLIGVLYISFILYYKNFLYSIYMYKLIIIPINNISIHRRISIVLWVDVRGDVRISLSCMKDIVASLELNAVIKCSIIGLANTHWSSLWYSGLDLNKELQLESSHWNISFIGIRMENVAKFTWRYKEEIRFILLYGVFFSSLRAFHSLLIVEMISLLFREGCSLARSGRLSLL